MIDRLRQMAIFAKSMDHGSFRGAARELQLSPSVVSHHISQLEEHLGVALIYRSTRKLALTRDGEKLLIVTRKMLDAVEGELEDLAATAGEPSGELRVTLPSVLSQSRLTARIADFMTVYPRIQLTLDFSDTRREIISDRFDMAIRIGQNAKTSSTSRKLFSVKRKLVATTECLASYPPIREPKDLSALPWLTLAPAQNAQLVLRNADGRKASIKPEPRLTTNDAQSLYQLARVGAGIAIVPDFLAEDDAASGHMSYVLPDWEIPQVEVFANWPANAPKHGLIHLALNHLTL